MHTAASPNESTRARPLILGFAASLVLLVLTVGGAAVQVSRVQSSALEVVDRSERSTYLIGEVGEQFARLQNHVSEYVNASPSDRVALETGMRNIGVALDRDTAELPATLDRGTRHTWMLIRPRLQELRGKFVQSIAASDAGDTIRAQHLLSEAMAHVASVHDDLETMSIANTRAVAEGTRYAQSRLRRVHTFEAMMGSILLFGNVAIWMSVLRILERQRQQAQKYVAAIESANQDLDAFAGRVAHDLKNILSPLLLSAPSLRHSAQRPRDVEQLADRIERCTMRAVGLIEGLLAFSRAGASATHGSASMHATVDLVAEELQSLATSVDATLETDVEDAQVDCAPGLLQLVLSNLCSNALKFLRGCNERSVFILTRVQEPYCLLEVRDTGPGIPADAMDRIFEPFYRVPGTSAPGTGIGLATVRRVVDAHDGRISAESKLGSGSCFRVWLPLVKQAHIASAERAAAVG
jgi:two-component system OmpR family sensor kinase